MRQHDNFAGAPTEADAGVRRGPGGPPHRRGLPRLRLARLDLCSGTVSKRRDESRRGTHECVRHAGSASVVLGWAVLLLLLLLATPVFGQRAYKHPVSGFTLRLPPGWTAESGPVQSLLLPPGVKVDPDREDNPEIYLVEIHPGVVNPEDESLVVDIRAGILEDGIGLEQAEEKGTFIVPGGLGVTYTWEFRNPRNNIMYRMRLYAVKTKGHVVTLLAQGERGKMDARDKLLQQVATTLDAPPVAAAAPKPAPPPKPAPAKSEPPKAEMKPEPPPPPAPKPEPKPEPKREPAAPEPPVDDKPDDSPLAKLWVARLYGRILSVPGETTGPLQQRVILRRDETWSNIAQPTLEAIDAAPRAGQWRVATRGTQTFLQLRPNGGTAILVELKFIGGKVYLGNQPAVLEDPR